VGRDGAESARLEADEVTALCVLPDGRLASGAYMIRLWDVKAGAESGCLEARSWVTALCVLPDGRLASGSYNEDTVQLWDLKAGAKTESAPLEGHWAVMALCVLPDGRLASGSAGPIMQLWDVKAGTEGVGLGRHSGGVFALCVLAPRARASKRTQVGSQPCACCRTGGSPQAQMTTRSGCGT
jgi:WD40 repeat protein